jgi:cobalt/nickel transport system permease protein
LAAILLIAGAVAALDRLLPSLAALAIGLLLLGISNLPIRWMRARLAVFALAASPFLLILPFTLDLDGPGWEFGSIRVSERGLKSGLAVFSRCLAIGCFALILVGAAPLHHTLAAAHRLKVPGLLVLLALLTYRYAFLLNEELRRMRIALRVRGFRSQATRHGYRTTGHVVGAVLVRGSDRAERVAEAMRCRGFDGRFHSLAEFRTRPSDVVCFLLAILGSAALILWDRL